MICYYLEGENIKPTTVKEARALIGKYVRYLRREDIDRSGRGYFFPKSGKIVDAVGKNIAIDSSDNFCIYLSDLREMVEIK